jgi:pyridoxine/pyridoxamine 5'-phosphate oxidase
MKIASTPPRRITSVHFRQRARNYQLAAAVSDAPRDVETFLDLAMMFEQLAEQFARAEARPRSL